MINKVEEVASSSKIRLGVLGLSGKMGQTVFKNISQPPFCDQLELVSRGADIWVDFSSPEAVIQWYEKASALDKGSIFLVGSTGWTSEQKAQLKQLSPDSTVLFIPNFSEGVLNLLKLIQTLTSNSELNFFNKAQLLLREVHHVHKKDSPSGTAKLIAEFINRVFRRTAPIESIREGEVIGVHEVIFETPFEKIKLVHEAKNRDLFAIGALHYALKLFPLKSRLPKRQVEISELAQNYLTP